MDSFFTQKPFDKPLTQGPEQTLLCPLIQMIPWPSRNGAPNFWLWISIRLPSCHHNYSNYSGNLKTYGLCRNHAMLCWGSPLQSTQRGCTVLKKKSWKCKVVITSEGTWDVSVMLERTALSRMHHQKQIHFSRARARGRENPIIPHSDKPGSKPVCCTTLGTFYLLPTAFTPAI